MVNTVSVILKEKHVQKSYSILKFIRIGVRDHERINLVNKDKEFRSDEVFFLFVICLFVYSFSNLVI